MNKQQAELTLIDSHIAEVRQLVSQAEKAAERIGTPLGELLAAKQKLEALRERLEQLLTARDIVVARMAAPSAASGSMPHKPAL